MKETKATRIRKLLNSGASANAIAKAIKCNVSYVYQVAKARAIMDAADYEVMTDKTIVRDNSPVEIEVIHNKRKKAAVKKFKDQVVNKKKFSEFDASPKAIAWKKRHPWFGVDKDKTDYAIGLCMEAHTQNIDPKSSWYYTFINQGMLKYVPPRDEVAEWKAKNDGTPFVGSGVKEIFKQAAVDFNKILDKEYAAKKSILDEAQGIIWGDREKTYGEPDVNLKRIATLWNAFLVSRYKHGFTGEPYEITSEDVCWMMVLLKASRQMNTPKRDNLVDAAGYIGLIERIQK